LAKAATAAAVKLYLIAELVDLDAKAVEFDLVLPVIAGRHGLGQDGTAGLDVLEQHTQDVAALRSSNLRRALAVVPRHKDDGCDAFA
jgi:hypothetical protein